VGLAAAGLLVAAPLLLLSAGAVVLTSGRPALYRQRRVGRGGKPFTLVKLRTMRPSSGGAQVTRRDDDRITPVGRLLRRTKLDELPELWNVLRGDMSFVGPRPEVERFVQSDDPQWQEILRVRPGLTDPVTLNLRDEERLLAAVPGDPEAYYRETLQPLKLAGYVAYLRRRTWKTDILVICDTLRTIVVPSRARPPVGPDGPRS
jgi:lipopolysaccharide/colanic/teichoic acid biosynthesis glycosyltransferase